MEKNNLRHIFLNTDKERIKGHIVLLRLGEVVAICTIAAVISLSLDKLGMAKENLLMIFLIGVFFATIIIPGYVYGFLTSLVSVLICNYFFTPPKYSFSVNSNQDFILLVFFFLTALIGGYLSSRQAAIARKSEKNMQLMNEERNKIAIAIESERLKNTLLRSVSHDIRTPLTVIMGASSTIIENFSFLDEDSIKGLVRDINEESAQLIITVQNILDMTRITEGKLKLKMEFEAVNDIIAQVVSRVPFLTSKNRLDVVIPDETIIVEVDGQLLIQALFNLLDNAYKYSEENTIVTLSVRTTEDCVIFEVSDNGNGIDASIRDTLFDSFVTLPRYSSDKGRGMGLGLSICKAIVSAHSGEITAENKSDGGALFTVKLPYRENKHAK
ncbi:MAG: DUF4118 domain-containing protein [Oscillospiraceae bacterium]|nr:DUF4118 domain-containing protein [Oscillospiraceae bacterium]